MTKWARPGISLLLILGFLQQAHSLQSTTTVQGVVINSMTGRPLADVRVSAITAAALPLAGQPIQSQAALTNDEGRFQFNLRAGHYRIEPQLAGYVFVSPPYLKLSREPGVWIQVPGNANASGLEIRMQPEAVITGRVLDANGQPVPGNAASVTLMQYSYDQSGKRVLSSVPGITYGGAGSFVRMDDRGEYRFFGLPPGDYYVATFGGPYGGNPPRRSVRLFYPGTVDESRAEKIHLEAGQEIRLSTMTFQTEPAINVHLRFMDLPGDAPVGRNIMYESGAGYSISYNNGLPEADILVTAGRHEVFAATENSWARVMVDAQGSESQVDVPMSPGFRAKINFVTENSEGARSPLVPATGQLRCALRSETVEFQAGCRSVGAEMFAGNIITFGSRATPTIPPDSYRLEFSTLPENLFVLAASASGQDALYSPVVIQKDTEIEVVLSSSGATLRGSVLRATGSPMPDAVVVLVPEGEAGKTLHLYRSGIADSKGNFELRLIAPGAYRLYAWQELEGMAYLNSEFMKTFEGRGKLVRIDKGASLSIDVPAVE